MRPLGLSRQELWSAGPDRLSGGNGRARRRCAWGSWGGPGRGRVQICCKGAPGRDRRRAEARNINDSPPASQRDSGLCNRFGQTAPPVAPRGESPRRLFSGRMAAFSLDHLRSAGSRRSDPRSRGRNPGRDRGPQGPQVRPSFPGAECASRRPGRGGVGCRGPRDRRVTAEHVT